MDISLGIAVAVMLVGLIILLVMKRYFEIACILFATGLLATLLKYAGHASLHLG